jgi:hypothetical protein
MNGGLSRHDRQTLVSWSASQSPLRQGWRPPVALRYPRRFAPADQAPVAHCGGWGSNEHAIQQLPGLMRCTIRLPVSGIRPFATVMATAQISRKGATLSVIWEHLAQA